MRHLFKIPKVFNSNVDTINMHNRSLETKNLIIAIGVRWYKDGLTAKEVKKKIKLLIKKSDSEILNTFNTCLGLPGTYEEKKE